MVQIVKIPSNRTVNCCDVKEGTIFSAETLDCDKVEWRTLTVENLIGRNEISDEEELINIRKSTKQHKAVIQARNDVFSVSRTV